MAGRIVRRGKFAGLGFTQTRLLACFAQLRHQAAKIFDDSLSLNFGIEGNRTEEKSK